MNVKLKYIKKEVPHLSFVLKNVNWSWQMRGLRAKIHTYSDKVQFLKWLHLFSSPILYIGRLAAPDIFRIKTRYILSRCLGEC